MNSRRWNILSADDENTTVEILSKKIKKHYEENINLSLANNGLEVIEKIKKQVPDILITDICMPIKSVELHSKTIFNGRNISKH